MGNCENLRKGSHQKSLFVGIKCPKTKIVKTCDFSGGVGECVSLIEGAKLRQVSKLVQSLDHVSIHLAQEEIHKKIQEEMQYLGHAIIQSLVYRSS